MKGRAESLRRQLAAPKVERAEFFVDDARHKQITFHDLRATHLTFARTSSWSDGRVQTVGLLMCRVHGLDPFHLACGHVVTAERADLPSSPLDVCSMHMVFANGDSYTFAVFTACDECARFTGIAIAPETVPDLDALLDAGSAGTTPTCARCLRAWRERHGIAATQHKVVEHET